VLDHFSDMGLPSNPQFKRFLIYRSLWASFLERNTFHAYYFLRNTLQKYPSTAEGLQNAEIYKQWWYYTIELLPEVITKGLFLKDAPFLPRILMRNCELTDMYCLDLGSVEGLMPVLMVRGGARHVLSTDHWFLYYKKLKAVQHYYNVTFQFKQLGLLYGRSGKLGMHARGGFDFVNLSGILYHVFSPLQVIASIRPLVKENGLIIVSTNVMEKPGYFMEFNNAGKLQTDHNTFWYMSIQLMDYVLRYFRLKPIDCLYCPHQENDPVRYSKGFKTGYLTVLCRAVKEFIADPDDDWMQTSFNKSLEYIGLCNEGLLNKQPKSTIQYKSEVDKDLLRADGSCLDLYKAVTERPPLMKAEKPADTHLLRLQDQS